MSEKKEEFNKVIVQIERMLETLEFGSVTLVVQNGKVIQIEKNEKIRMK
ncbi:YezD family protein [Bacillus taeanensis]|uniref:DUF2292 domain-containing protein n=1 Tax=Bacillus taeanensis TaxID=273032 RepID=A0A366XWY3_9BACI|nr:YezD family protein [Bacillus taeanensis]RBW70900.1 DUF2292 domain-containing protein [Bacillus taeanensis]